MINCVEKVYNKIGNKAEQAFVNDVEKVYNAKINQSGGFGNVNSETRRLAWQTSVDEVSTKLRYRVANILW